MRAQQQVVDGMTFRVHTSGHSAPGAPTYVLLHGIGTSHRYLARLHARLARGAQVHSLDLPGFGGVPKPSEAPSIPAVADALGTLLDRLGVRDAVLLGHSMGTQWAVETALVRPDLTRAVVLIGPVVNDRRRTMAAQTADLAWDVLGESPSANLMVALDYLRCGPVWFFREMRYMLAYPMEDRVALLAVPLLIIRGGTDAIAPLAWCRRLRAHAGHGRLRIVPGHRHNVQHNAPTATASAIANFLAAQTTPMRGRP